MTLHPDRGALSRLVAVSGVEALSDGISRTLMPIVAITVLGVGGLGVGVVNSASLIAFLACSVPFGAAVDRRGWRATSLMANGSLVRAGVCACLVLSWLAGFLQGASGVAILLAAAFLIGLCDVVFSTGQGVATARMTDPTDVSRQIGRMQAAGQASAALGPIVLGAVLAVMGAPLAWLVPVGGYLVSTILSRSLHGERRPTPVSRGGERGWRTLLRRPSLVRLSLANAVFNCAVTGANVVVPLVTLASLGIGAPTYAALGALGSVAGVVGAMVAPALDRILGLARARVLALILALLGCAALAGAWGGLLPGSPLVWVAAQQVATGFSTAVTLVVGSDLPARLIVPERLASVLGAQRTLVLGVMPLAGVAIGLIVDGAGLGVALAVWATLLAGSAIPLIGLRDERGIDA